MRETSSRHLDCGVSVVRLWSFRESVCLKRSFRVMTAKVFVDRTGVTPDTLKANWPFHSHQRTRFAPNLHHSSAGCSVFVRVT